MVYLEFFFSRFQFSTQTFIKLDCDGNDCFVFFPPLCFSRSFLRETTVDFTSFGFYEQITTSCRYREPSFNRRVLQLLLLLPCVLGFLSSTGRHRAPTWRDIFSFLVTLLHKKKTSTHTHTQRPVHLFQRRFKVSSRLSSGINVYVQEGVAWCVSFFFTSSGWMCDKKIFKKANTHREGSWTRSLRLTPLRSSARFRKQLSLTG